MRSRQHSVILTESRISLNASIDGHFKIRTMCCDWMCYTHSVASQMTSISIKKLHVCPHKRVYSSVSVWNLFGKLSFFCEIIFKYANSARKCCAKKVKNSRDVVFKHRNVITFTPLASWNTRFLETQYRTLNSHANLDSFRLSSFFSRTYIFCVAN